VDNLCYLNGGIVSLEDAHISLQDRGILYGDGLFETIRVYDGKPFLLEKHIGRMSASASALDIEMPGSVEEINNAVSSLLSANRVKDGSLRMTLTRGAGMQGLWPWQKGKSTFFITSNSNIPYSSELYREGFKVALISFPLNEYSPQAAHKTLNFLDYLWGRREAEKRGFQEGIFLNQKRYLAEGTVSNLFLLKGEVLYTPPLEAGVLPGITRELILNIAAELVEVKEENIPPSWLREATEVFLTNSLMEIMPVVKVETQPVNTGEPGLLTGRLRRLYRDYVQSEQGGS